MKQLDRLLFEQGGDCFFCKQPLAKADASVEHLLAQANGGTSAEENVVACCKAVNALLGNKPLKEKFAVILRQKSGFHCPAKTAVAEHAVPKPVTEISSPKALTPPISAPAASKRPGPAAKKAPALKAVSSKGILALAASSPAAVTCPTCRQSVVSAVGQIDYVCPRCRNAFRY